MMEAYASTPLDECEISSGMTVTIRGGSKTSFSLLGSAKGSVEEKIKNEYLWKEALQVGGGESSDLVEEVYEQLVEAGAVGLGVTGSADTSGVDCGLTAKRVIIPADNSCLFNAIGYLLEHPGADVDTVAAQSEVQKRLRSVVAESVIAQPDVYSESVLGMTPQKYAMWIRDSAHWGGEIEIAVLCGHYRVGIRVVDVCTGSVYHYCPLGDSGGNATTRYLYLLYDGIHYDALVATAQINGVFRFGGGGGVIKTFGDDKGQSVESVNCMFKALAAGLKAAGGYTNLSSKDTCIQCMVCYKRCAGETEATQHAMATKHQNFRQIN